jgi:hypothetical protein
MKKLNINITKAQLKSYTITLEDGKPVISATCELLTEGGKPVTTYTASTRKYDWEATTNFELPLAAIGPIVELARILEEITVQNCRDSQMALESGADEDPIKPEDLTFLTLPANNTSDDDEEEDIDDKPIDLSEIPF